ncbi:hypothetical protein MUK42_28706 [Musa troglodytarum]|uniref:Uncharacterized protein n=1 Tax=Musa troglodytarum TaxID=320322 RepID=A0A9E7GDZ7_9LILI|nr:hypothetical protein MUK42_28706 [Musa troglodytarum]
MVTSTKSLLLQYDHYIFCAVTIDKSHRFTDTVGGKQICTNVSIAAAFLHPPAECISQTS